MNKTLVKIYLDKMVNSCNTYKEVRELKLMLKEVLEVVNKKEYKLQQDAWNKQNFTKGGQI